MDKLEVVQLSLRFEVKVVNFNLIIILDGVFQHTPNWILY